MDKKMTFGQVITQARRRLNLTQKALAARIVKEDGQPISLPYLVDIEHDRRSPTSDHLIRQFAAALEMPPEFLYIIVKRIPAEVADIFNPINVDSIDFEKAIAAYRAFRKVLEDNIAA